MIALRAPVSTDHNTLGRIRADYAVQHMLMANPDAEMGDNDLKSWLERRLQAGAFWSIVNDLNDCIGFAQFSGLNRKNRYAWVGIALVPEVQRNGFGALAMKELLKKADELGLFKLLLEVRVDNTPAIEMYKKLHFSQIGILRDHYDDGTRRIDVILMERRVRKPEDN